jgi:glucan phosphorylase
MKILSGKSLCRTPGRELAQEGAPGRVLGSRRKMDLMERTLTVEPEVQIAYFSMEIAVAPEIPTYSGGLGILAGDFLRSAADHGVPMVGITLLHRKGYFHQHLDRRGQQSETPEDWHPENILESVEPAITLDLNGRHVKVRAWRFTVEGITGRRNSLRNMFLPEVISARRTGSFCWPSGATKP